MNWTASAILRNEMKQFVGSDLFARQRRLARFNRVRNGGFITEHQVYSSDEDIGADPIYRDFLWPAGLGWCAGRRFRCRRATCSFLLSNETMFAGRPDFATVQQLDLLRPHIGRSALISARLQLERARVASETGVLRHRFASSQSKRRIEFTLPHFQKESSSERTSLASIDLATSYPDDDAFSEILRL